MAWRSRRSPAQSAFISVYQRPNLRCLRCSTLEACCALGLDTREICRKVYERPVQVLLQRLDPRLHFTRNYARLRPYAPYCEEIITLET